MAVVVAVALAIFILPGPWGIVAIFLGILFEIVENVFWFRYQARRRVQTGVEGHVGERAEVTRALDPEGQVRFRGELWKARAEEPIAAGESVRIAEVDRLTLVVERAQAASSRPSQ
jgi:membrane-bound serine protease (ClpP class)